MGNNVNDQVGNNGNVDTRAAERIGLPKAVTVQCPCGKRLAILDITTGASGEQVDGHFFGPRQSGQPVIADDWRRIICPGCGKDWRGWESRLVEIVRDAKRRGATSATLGARRPPAPSRDWSLPRRAL